MSLSNLGVEWIAATAIFLFAFAYAALWAFTIRGKLVVKLYRHQALGVGFVAISFGYFAWGVTSNTNYIPEWWYQFPWDNIIFFLIIACLIPLLYWTDSSLLAARDSDPLQRDVLHWRGIRAFVWPAVVICLVAGGVYTVYQSIFLTQAVQQAGNSVYLVGVPGALSFGLVVVPEGLPLVVALVFLPLAVRRTKDITIRRHMKWFSLGALFLLAGELTYGFVTNGQNSLSSSYLAPIPFVAVFVVSAYCLYRSARAVIPIYSFEEGAS